MRFLFLLFTVIVFSGCAIAPRYTPAPEAPEGMSLVYLMRGDVERGGFWATQFTIDDKVIVDLQNNDYSWLYLKPGSYKVKAAGLVRTLTVDKGGDYYLEYHLGFNGYQFLKYFKQLSSEEIKNQLVESTYVQGNSYESAPLAKVRDFVSYDGDNRSYLDINYGTIYKNTYPKFSAHIYDDYEACEGGYEFFPSFNSIQDKYAIEAGAPVTIEVQVAHQSSYLSLACVQSFTFTPKINESYSVKVGVINSQSLRKLDKCTVQVVRESDNQPVKIQSRSQPLKWTNDSPRCDKNDFRENDKTDEIIKKFDCRANVSGNWRDC